jgi:hypothetical protein
MKRLAAFIVLAVLALSSGTAQAAMQYDALGSTAGTGPVVILPCGTSGSCTVKPICAIHRGVVNLYLACPAGRAVEADWAISGPATNDVGVTTVFTDRGRFSTTASTPHRVPCHPHLEIWRTVRYGQHSTVAFVHLRATGAGSLIVRGVDVQNLP